MPRTSPDSSLASCAPASAGSVETPNSMASALALSTPVVCDRTSRSHAPDAVHCSATSIATLPTRVSRKKGQVRFYRERIREVDGERLYAVGVAGEIDPAVGQRFDAAGYTRSIGGAADFQLCREVQPSVVVVDANRFR